LIRFYIIVSFAALQKKKYNKWPLIKVCVDIQVQTNTGNFKLYNKLVTERYVGDGT
jgi:hypothetical protein